MDVFYDSFDFFIEEEKEINEKEINEKSIDDKKSKEQTEDSSSSSLFSELTIQPNRNTTPQPRMSRNRITKRLSQKNSSQENSHASSSSAITSETIPQDPNLTIHPTPEHPNRSLLLSLAGVVIKLVFFQLNLLVGCFKFPLIMAQYSVLTFYDPFGMVKCVKNAIKEGCLRVLNWVSNSNQGFGKLVVRLGIGCFWCVFVGSVLVGILLTAFLGASLVMKRIVEEPLQIAQDLNFDYTKSSPDAFVSLDSLSGGADCNMMLEGKAIQAGMQVKPMNMKKVQMVISLTLPESDYNRRLGMFQVRAEFLSASGKIMYSTSRPCVLRFKSPHIRFAETFLKACTLLAGYSSESQTIKIKLTGSIEGNEPTACVRVVLEQRAEYKPSAGIPEIYAASLKLELLLPFLKRILWNWRKTIFIWVGISLFFLKLLFVLICCSPIIISRTISRRQATRST